LNVQLEEFKKKKAAAKAALDKKKLTPATTPETTPHPTPVKGSKPGQVEVAAPPTLHESIVWG
jgi:hypothetical protein